MNQKILSEAIFWDLIEKSLIEGEYSIQLHLERYRSSLLQLSNDELLSFKLIHLRLKEQAENTRVSQAIYILNNGCGDDDFQNFMAGLIAQGRKIYYDFIENPETTLLSLSNAIDLIKCEAFDYVPDQIYCERTGIESLEPADFLSNYSEDPVDLKKQHPLLFAKFWKS